MKWLRRFWYFGTAWLYVTVTSALLGYMVSECWGKPNSKVTMVLIAVFWPFVYPVAFLLDWFDVDIDWRRYKY